MAVKLTKAQVNMLREVKRIGWAKLDRKGYRVGSRRFGEATGERLYREEMMDVMPGRRDIRIVSAAGDAYLATL